MDVPPEVMAVAVAVLSAPKKDSVWLGCRRSITGTGVDAMVWIDRTCPAVRRFSRVQTFEPRRALGLLLVESIARPFTGEVYVPTHVAVLSAADLSAVEELAAILQIAVLDAPPDGFEAQRIVEGLEYVSRQWPA